jgi:hypothetical protein
MSLLIKLTPQLEVDDCLVRSDTIFAIMLEDGSIYYARCRKVGKRRYFWLDWELAARQGITVHPETVIVNQQGAPPNWEKTWQAWIRNGTLLAIPRKIVRGKPLLVKVCRRSTAARIDISKSPVKTVTVVSRPAAVERLITELRVA